MTAECSIDDCGEKVLGRGMCRYHYRQWARWDESEPHCTEDGCTFRQWAKGLCVLHYERNRHRNRPVQLCSVDGCGRRTKARGLCSVHYQTGRPRAKKAKVQGGPCGVPGCDGDAVSRGLCDRHYQMWRLAQMPSVSGYCSTCEDIEFMAASGEVLDGVVARLGMADRGVLRSHLSMHGKVGLYARLRGAA